jgi:hypothetical protein
MKKLYKLAKETDYSYAFAEWLEDQYDTRNSNLFKTLCTKYINMIKSMHTFNPNDFSYISVYGIERELNIPDDIESYSYNEINSYIKEVRKTLPELLLHEFLNDELGAILIESSSDAGAYLDDIIKNWIEEGGLDEFCEEEEINKNNIDIDSTMKYLNKLLNDDGSGFEYFTDQLVKEYFYELKGSLKDYIYKGLDEFMNYFLEDVFKLRDEKYNEEKKKIDEQINQEKADDYMRDIIDKGIDYQKLEGKLKNRIIRRMAKMKLI